MAAVPYIHNVGKQVQKLQNSKFMDRNRRKWYTVQKTSDRDGQDTTKVVNHSHVGISYQLLT